MTVLISESFVVMDEGARYILYPSRKPATYIAEFLSRIIPRFKYDIEVYTASSCALTLFDKIAQGAMTIHISDECWAVAHFSCHSV